jgi:hypothetical protein
MRKLICLIVFLVPAFCAAPALSQDAESAQEAGPEAAATEDATAADLDEAAEPEAIDDEPLIDLDDPDLADLDRQTYEEDDDDFVPTEEVPADEAIPFPTDI